MFRQVLAIAGNTFLESIRQPIYIVLLLAGGLMQAANTLLSAYSMAHGDASELAGDNKLLLDMGLATVFVVATLLTGFIATAVVSREIEDRTVLMVIAKPVGRPVFVIGKHLGVTAAILLATLILLVFFFLAIRHEVMSTARDHVDGPVVLFGALAVVIAVAVGVWGNFFYGWVFSSVAVLTLAPLSLVAWLGVLLIDKKWAFQPIATDFKPQILLASACVMLAMPVLTSIAVAAGTRLGQVMTIVVCAGAFILGLLSNYLLGRPAFDNSPAARIVAAEPVEDADSDLSEGGDVWRLTVDRPPPDFPAPGAPIYYGANPNGLRLAVPRQEGAFAGDPSSGEALRRAETPALVLRTVEVGPQYVLTIANAGGLAVERPPAPGDLLFLRPTGVNPLAFVAWSVVPNLQFFWLVDAITQGHPIPGRYLGLVSAYSFVQVAGFLCVGIILFQKRDVG